MRRLLRAGFLALVAIPLLSLLAGCGGKTVAADDCTAYQDPYNRGDADAHPPLTIVAVDLFTNRAGFEEAVVVAVRPVLAQALEHGSYVKLVGDGGTGTEVAASSCFAGIDAAKPFLVKSGSQDHDRDDWAAGSGVLADKAGEYVRSLPVAEHGSLTRLAAVVTQYARDAHASGRVGAINVVFVANLLGNTTPEDCLHVDGATATPTAADDIAARCFANGQLVPMAGVDSVRFAGAGYGATTAAQTVLATSLANALAPRFTEQATR
jgi:hypothetical protein